MRPELESIGHAFVGADVDSMAAAFARAASAIAQLSLDRMLRDDARAAMRELATLIGPIDHVGFIAPPTPVAALAEAATRADFSRHVTFPSRVLALELGARLGVAQVPTSIFKARGAAGVVEVFMPDAAPEVVSAWMADGVGTHVATQIDDRRAFPRAMALLAEAGFTRPPGIGVDPLGNPAEHILVTYFDGVIAGRALRLELCSSDDED